MDTGPMHLLPNSCLKDSHYNGIASPVLVVIEFQGNHLGSAWPATRFGIAAGYSRANGFELEICYVYCSIRLLGLGMILFESSCLAVKLSNLPNFTSQSGPPVSATASLEAMIMILAQETTPGQAFSRASLTLSTTSNDLREFILERVNFSPSIVGVSSSNIEASHPLVHLPGELFLQFASALRIEINRGFSALSTMMARCVKYCCRMVFSNGFADFVQSCYGLVSMTRVAVCLGVVDCFFLGCELAFLQDLHKLDSVVHANSVYGLLQASFLLAWISTNYAANWFCRLGCSCCRWSEILEIPWFVVSCSLHFQCCCSLHVAGWLESANKCSQWRRVLVTASSTPVGLIEIKGYVVMIKES
ncbi:hypothetical protein KIW84_053767 [Lathyrus oleraceus]|uniref:Uncharacterized protein n=1 Tax=Pisum sativum TaxID=3888 RepID=A0A9D4WTV9_PEA|nr:hypothetical protein KIW84_053767 [Pisum sativum]